MSKPVLEDLFRFSGRRNRRSYLLYCFILSIFQLILWGIAIAVDKMNGGLGLVIFALLLSIPCLVSGWAVGSQRCRDFGWTGWAVLITLIPAIGWLFGLAILFIPGTPGDNSYGPDPLGA